MMQYFPPFYSPLHNLKKELDKVFYMNLGAKQHKRAMMEMARIPKPIYQPRYQDPIIKGEGAESAEEMECDSSVTEQGV